MLHDIWTAIDEGRYADAERLLEADAELGAGRAGQMALGHIYTHTGRFDEARALFTALREAAREEADDWEHIAVHQLGLLERAAGDLPGALAHFQEEERLIQALGDRPHKRAVNACALGLTALAMNDLEAARTHLECSLEQARRQDDPEALGAAEQGLGDLCLAEGEAGAAREHYLKAQAAFEDAEDEAALRELAARLRQLSPAEA